MAKATLEVVDTTIQKLLTGDILNLGTEIVKSGRAINLDTINTIGINNYGLYKVNVTLTVVPVGTDPVVITLLNNGKPLKGATISVTAISGVVATLGMTCLLGVNKPCPCTGNNKARLQLVTDSDIEITTSNVVIEQVI